MLVTSRSFYDAEFSEYLDPILVVLHSHCQVQLPSVQLFQDGDYNCEVFLQHLLRVLDAHHLVQRHRLQLIVKVLEAGVEHHIDEL
jgi:hypothetical protein